MCNVRMLIDEDFFMLNYFGGWKFVNIKQLAFYSSFCLKLGKVNFNQKRFFVEKINIVS